MLDFIFGIIAGLNTAGILYLLYDTHEIEKVLLQIMNSASEEEHKPNSNYI